MLRALPLKLATDAEVDMAIRVHRRARPLRYRRMKTFAAGKLEPPPLAEIGEGLAGLLEEVFGDIARGDWPMRKMVHTELLEQVGASKVDTVGVILAEFARLLIAKARDPQVLERVQDLYEEYRADLRAAAEPLREHVEEIVSGLDAAAFMRRYGRRVSSSQADMMQATVEKEREGMRKMFAVVLGVIESDDPVDVVSLLGALALDHQEAVRIHDRCHSKIDAVGAQAT